MPRVGSRIFITRRRSLHHGRGKRRLYHDSRRFCPTLAVLERLDEIFLTLSAVIWYATLSPAFLREAPM